MKSAHPDPVTLKKEREDGSIELIVLGLLAALIVVLAIPVLDISEENPVGAKKGVVEEGGGVTVLTERTTNK